jgi:hypothetical protein
MPKDAFWFPHDSNARNDQFILEMRAKYGSQGYGWFWMLIEMMRDESQYRLRVSNCNAFAMQLNCQPDAVSTFIEDCIQKYKLFTSDGEWFWSDSLRRRMKHKDAVSRERQKVAKIRWEKANANAMQLHSNSTANAMQNDAIRKEDKRKEEKTSYGEFGNLKMAETQMTDLRDQFPDIIDECVEASDGWIQEHSYQRKYTDWAAFLRNWCKREIKKRGTQPSIFDGAVT